MYKYFNRRIKHSSYDFYLRVFTQRLSATLKNTWLHCHVYQQAHENASNMFGNITFKHLDPDAQ
jgi:hypothetical protein